MTQYPTRDIKVLSLLCRSIVSVFLQAKTTIPNAHLTIENSPDIISPPGFFVLFRHCDWLYRTRLYSDSGTSCLRSLSGRLFCSGHGVWPASGSTWGATLGASAPATIIGCNTAFGTCQAVCAAVILARHLGVG
jgi:hypothetical protein